MKRDLEARMNLLLERLGIPLRAVWSPDADSNDHARIDVEEGLIIIYDVDEAEAMRSLFHEILEYRIRGLINPYRRIINSLIEAIEKLVYFQKEKVLDQVMHDFIVWKELGEFPAPINHRGERHERNRN
ncbi:hypothetical protein DRO64_07840 [Candidatus Bathyarchaeota archaeon]|nr:MAG: hypothetical protein DRO64_07840 [Candidatus Bathyarchaeota archaeon]